MLDAWLLEKFPGKTLEELDCMDFARYWRAMEVQNIQAIERLRDLQLKGSYQPQPSEWQRIRRHDRWIDDGDE